MSHGDSRSDRNFKEDESTMIHLTVTGRCYAQCKGCVNSAITLGSIKPRSSIIAFQETEPERDSTIILDLVSRLPDQAITVCFYGGEPFIAVDKMEKVWRILRESDVSRKIRYMIYTNGEHLIDALDKYPEFMHDMWLYSISIDGDKEQHNRVRQGTNLDNIIKNVKSLRKNYDGHVLHWSTLREEQSALNCFEEFIRLYEQGIANHFFWHWAETIEPYENFPVYVELYGQELEEIMNTYVEYIKDGNLLPICHINELILYLITGKQRGCTACSVELAKNYDVVSGKVFACADLPAAFIIGELNDAGKLNLRECDLSSLVEYKNWLGCYQCGVHAYCGGRCPVQAITGTKGWRCQGNAWPWGTNFLLSRSI